MAQLYFEDVQEGQEIPPFVRKTDYMNWNRYAAVNDEFVYIHMDDEAGQIARQPGGFGMGNLRFAYMHNLLHQWMGDEGDIRKLGIQYRGFNFKNDILTCKGKVLKKYTQDADRLVDLEIWVENQKGEVVTPGKAPVAGPPRGSLPLAGRPSPKARGGPWRAPMNFVKMQGTGNDFVLIRPEGEGDWPRLAQAICDRHYGVGADQLILVLPSEVADFRMRIFNPDGSEAEMCGNGIRCFAKYVVEEGLTQPRSTLAVETLAGVRRLFLELDSGGVRVVRVGMGEPRFRPEEIPMRVGEGPLDIIINYPLIVDDQELKVSALSLGNPHAVHLIDSPVVDFPLDRVGPKVEHHPAFPQRVNFEVARVLDRGRIEARVWERGAGPTLACGTGACAVAVAARLHGLIGDEVDIMLPGGGLHISWDGRGEVYLAGPAETVFRGEWEE